jgi:hypothetical protein
VLLFADVVSASRDEVLGYHVWQIRADGEVVTELGEEWAPGPVIGPTQRRATVLGAAESGFLLARTARHYVPTLEYRLSFERVGFAGTSPELLAEPSAVAHWRVDGAPGAAGWFVGATYGPVYEPRDPVVSRHAADGQVIFRQTGIDAYGTWLTAIAAAPDEGAVGFIFNFEPRRPSAHARRAQQQALGLARQRVPRSQARDDGARPA